MHLGSIANFSIFQKYWLQKSKKYVKLAKTEVNKISGHNEMRVCRSSFHCLGAPTSLGIAFQFDKCKVRYFVLNAN